MDFYNRRKYLISAIITTMFVLLIFRLVQLQIIDTSYKLNAENNSQRRIIQYPARGMMYDRNGKLLVCNQIAYDLMLIPMQMKSFDTLAFLTDMQIDIDDFNRRLQKAKQYSYYRPSEFYKQMSKEQFAFFQEHLYRYPGFYVQVRSLREYKTPIAAQVLGDVGEVNIDMINNDRYYEIGDYAGKSGLEINFEKLLRGEKGVKIYLVDVHNRVQGSYMNGAYDTLAVPGKNLELTIDADLQAYGENLMQNKIGSIVAIEPSSGEILAIVSSPTYDPNLLVGRHRGYNYDSLLNHPDLPLYNRAVTAAYPPGSIFKMAMALIGLQEGVISKYTSLPCDQSLVACHGHLPNSNLMRAIQYSCNPYFYIVGKRIIQQGVESSIFRDSRIGLTKWKKSVVTLGFEQKFDIGIPAVFEGFIPGPEYYDKLYGKHSWAYSTIYSLSIGQGEVLVTPLQMANFTAVIANRGYYYIPHLVKKIDDELVETKYRQKIITPFEEEYFKPLVDGMYAVVNEEFGTGGLARVDDLNICGKTGTAQNPHGEDHSIFIAFAPKENPQIAIAVYVENAGFGGVWAAPIASLMIEKYLNDTITNKWSENRVLDANLINLEAKER